MKDLSVGEDGIAIDPAWFQDHASVKIEIQAGEKSAPVRVTFSAEQILAVTHQG